MAGKCVRNESRVDVAVNGKAALKQLQVQEEDNVMSTAARSHNVQLQSEATRESRDGDGGGEVEEWRQAEKGKNMSVCPEVDKRIWLWGG